MAQGSKKARGIRHQTSVCERDRSNPRHRIAGVKKWLLIAFAAVVLLIAAVAIVGPIAASRIARTVIADTVNESIEGTVRVDSVRVGWAGPIGADGVSLRDPQGTEVATLTARTNRGILGLGMSMLGGGGIDLGTITLTGSAILERGPDGELTIAQALAPRPAASQTPQRPTGAPAPTRQPPTTTAPSAPRGLRGTLDITGITIAVRDAGQPVAGLRDFTGGGPFEIGQPISMAFNATPMTATTPIQLTVEGTNLFDAGGTLTPDQAELVLALNAAMPDAEIDAGVRALTGATATPTNQPNTDATIDLALRLNNGRLTLHESKPARVSAAVPVSLAAAATSEAAGQFELQPGARLALVIDQLDIPTEGINSDWRGADINATLTTERLAGRFVIPGPTESSESQTAPTIAAAPEWRSFVLDTSPVRISLDPQSALLTVSAGAAGTIDGESAGTLALDAEVGDALAADGTIASTLPGILRGELEIDGVRTDAPWFALIERLAGAPIRAALGERATLTATASLPPIEERTGLLEVLANIALESPRTQADIGFGISSSSVRAHDGGINIETTAARPVLEALGIPMRDDAYQLDLAGTRAVVRVPAFLVPIVDRGPNLEAARGDLTVELRDVRGMVVEHNMPVDMQLLRLTAALKPGEPARANLLGTIAADGSPIGLRGGLTITTPGAVLTTDPDADPLVNIEQAGIAGELVLEGLPARLVSAFDTDLAALLEDAFGDRLALTLETSEWRAANTTGAADAANTSAATGLITLIAEGPRGRLRGPIDLTLAEAPTIATRGNGLQLLLQEPQRVIDRFPIEGITLGVDQPFVAYLVDVDASLPEAGPDIRSARLELLLPMLRANIAPVDPAGQPSALALREPRVDLTLTPDGWADLAIRAEQGEINGQPLTLDGSLGVRGAIARTLDPAGFLASSAPIETRGQWSIAGLNASALRVIDPVLVPLIDAALPGPIRVEIAASRTGATVDNDRSVEAPGFTLRILGNNQRLFATTRAALDGQQLIAGPTLTTLPITADLVRKGLAFAELDATEFPAPANPFDLRASATTMRYALDALAAGQPFDPLQTDGPWEARLGTTPADITFRMPLGDGPAAGTSIGVRGLSAFRTVVPGDAGASRQGAAVSFFDPPATGTGPGTPFGSFTASSTVDDLSQINIEGTALRLGKIAQRFGLGDVPMLALGAGESRLNITGGLTGTSTGAETNQRVEATASLAAPRLSLNGALRHDPATGSLNILQPFQLVWNLDRRFIQHFLLGHEPGNPAEQPNIRLQRDVPVRGSVQTLDLVLADENANRPMRVDRVAATLSTDPVTIVPRTGQPTELGGLRLDIQPDAQPGTLTLALRSGITPAGNAAAAANTGPVTADGRIRLPVGEQPGQLSLTARGDLPSLALDALARSGQTLTAVLGERAAFNLSVNQLTTDLTAGRITADMNSSNAVVRLRGNARDGLLELTSAPSDAGGPSEARLSVITPEASRILFEPLFPIFSNIEKRADQRPTLLSVDRMALPVDGDLTKLSGRFTLDFGEIAFATPPIVGSILSATGNRADGTIGTRLQPLAVTIEQGVASYEPWAIPIGEFTLQMSGKVNLAEQRVDEVMIYVPIGALAREISDQFTRIPLIGQAGMAAFRLSGPVGNLQIQPVLDPAALLGIPGTRQQGGIGNPLRDLIGGGRDSGRVDEETVDQINDILRNLRRRDRRPREDEQPPEGN